MIGGPNGGSSKAPGFRGKVIIMSFGTANLVLQHQRSSN